MTDDQPEDFSDRCNVSLEPIDVCGCYVCVEERACRDAEERGFDAD